MDEHDLRAEMAAYLELQPAEVRQHLTVCSPLDVGQDYYLRIDKKTPPVFTPNMPKTAMKAENDTVPRVTVAPTLLGCLIGYFRATHDIINAGHAPADKEEFKGGYEISAITFDLSLQPDNVLVPQEASRSDEHWLVPFNRDHTEFVPKNVGKCFISQFTYYNTGTNLPALKLELWLKADLDGFPLDPQHKLASGYYRVELWWKNLYQRSVQDPSEVLSVAAVSEEEWGKQKRWSADLLSHRSMALTPGFLAW